MIDFTYSNKGIVLSISLNCRHLYYMYTLYIGNKNQEKKERGISKYSRSNAKRAKQPKKEGKKDSLSLPAFSEET
jgi:hypothetical protein